MIDSSCPRLPKLNGADIELGNFLLGLPAVDTCATACRLLLAEIDGVPGSRSVYAPLPYSTTSGTHRRGSCGYDDEFDPPYSGDWYAPREYGRRFLPSNGGSAYEDMGHCELCLPEVLSAWDHVAAWHAMLRIASGALERANAKLPGGRSIRAMANNTDGHGRSWGSHLDFLVTRQAWNNIVNRKPHYLSWLASYQISSLIYTGQGKVGSENGSPPIAFQLSQRADFMEKLIGPETTSHRGIVNSRNETLCGPSSLSNDPESPARLHVIFFDNTLTHRSCLLKVGVMQLMLAMIEAEDVNPALILDDPLNSLRAYSDDPTLQARARLAGGGGISALELQRRYLREARRFAADGGFAGFVPREEEILDLWEDTLDRLQAADWPGLARRLDWVMKRTMLQRAMSQRPSLNWDSPEIRHLDQVYGSLGSDGLYKAWDDGGLVERLVPDERIQHFCEEPPSDTRAWTRAMLLRAAPPEWVESVDWDCISFRLRDGGYWPSYRRLDMVNPLRLTAADTAGLFPPTGHFSDLLDRLEAITDETEGGVPAARQPSNRETGICDRGKGSTTRMLPAVTIQSAI